MATRSTWKARGPAPQASAIAAPCWAGRTVSSPGAPRSRLRTPKRCWKACCAESAEGALLLGRRLESALRFGRRDQGRIKLYERLVDGGILGVTLLADRVGRQRLGGRLGAVEAEERPLGGRESRLVLQVNLDPGQSLLETPALVDRSFARRVANFERQHG